MGRITQGLTVAVVMLALAACGGGQQPAPQPGKATATATSSAPSSREEMVRQAEAAVRGELPDSPNWQGTTFRGGVVDDSTVCVDRTYPPGGGVEGKGGTAGYVMVTFPGAVTGKPMDGVCADAASAPPSTPAALVSVPDDLEGQPGVVTRTDMGEEWPLTVDYGVMACQSKTAGGMALQIATFTAPDGQVYALSGTAKDHTDAADIRPIWADEPDGYGAKVSIGPLIERARSLCG